LFSGNLSVHDTSAAYKQRSAKTLNESEILLLLLYHNGSGRPTWFGLNVFKRRLRLRRLRRRLSQCEGDLPEGVFFGVGHTLAADTKNTAFVRCLSHASADGQ
jgi:hypothetical protein